MFNRNKFDPDQAYDIKVAEMVLAEHKGEKRVTS